MIDYLGGLRDRPAYRHTSSRQIRSRLDSKLPIKGTDFDALLRVFRETIVPFSRQTFAHVRLRAIAWDDNRCVRRSACFDLERQSHDLAFGTSAGGTYERLTIDWVRQILGFSLKPAAFL